LKRMMFPFVSSLAKLREDNISLINQLLVIYDNYLLTKGLKRLATVSPKIELPYASIFLDVNTTVALTDEEQDGLQT